MGKKEGNGKNAEVHQIKRISDDNVFAAKIQTYVLSISIQSNSLREEISILS